MTWAFVAFAALLIFLTGNFTPLAGIVFGFIFFGLVFGGMIGVLPSTVGHNAPVEAAKPKKAPVVKEPAEILPGAAVHVR